MIVIVQINENVNSEKKIKEFKEFDLGEVTTTLDDLLNSKYIQIDENQIPIIKVTEDDVETRYIVNNINNEDATGSFQSLITSADLIQIGGGGSSSTPGLQEVLNTNPSAISTDGFSGIDATIESASIILFAGDGTDEAAMTVETANFQVDVTDGDDHKHINMGPLSSFKLYRNNTDTGKSNAFEIPQSNNNTTFILPDDKTDGTYILAGLIDINLQNAIDNSGFAQSLDGDSTININLVNPGNTIFSVHMATGAEYSQIEITDDKANIKNNNEAIFTTSEMDLEGGVAKLMVRNAVSGGQQELIVELGGSSETTQYRLSPIDPSGNYTLASQEWVVTQEFIMDADIILNEMTTIGVINERLASVDRIVTLPNTTYSNVEGKPIVILDTLGSILRDGFTIIVQADSGKTINGESSYRLGVRGGSTIFYNDGSGNYTTPLPNVKEAIFKCTGQNNSGFIGLTEMSNSTGDTFIFDGSAGAGGFNITGFDITKHYIKSVFTIETVETNFVYAPTFVAIADFGTTEFGAVTTSAFSSGGTIVIGKY